MRISEKLSVMMKRRVRKNKLSHMSNQKSSTIMFSFAESLSLSKIYQTLRAYFNWMDMIWTRSFL